MSDFFENNQEIKEQLPADDIVSEATTEETVEEESTVIAAPVEHKDKIKKKTGKKRLVSIIAVCLSVAILIGGTIAVIKLIPELKEDEVASSVFEDISLIDKDSSTFTKINITNTNGTFNFIKKQLTTTKDDGTTNTTTYWSVDDVDVSKLSTDSINTIISSTASITAIREITTKTEADCGFDKPLIKATIESNDKKLFGFTVGDASPDGLGHYFILDGSDKIYVVPTNELSDFQFKLIDLSNKTAIPTTMFTTDTSQNKEEDGSYAYFDSLTLSGSLYGDTLTIENNKEDNASVSIVPYIITTPSKRYAKAENITPLIQLFSNSVSVAGNYAFDINDKTLKEVGLDKPDAIVTMTINGESKTFKFSVVDNNYCAIIYDGATMIRKANTSSFAFLSLKIEDYYNQHPFMYSINDISELKLVDGDDTVKFDISYIEEEDSNRKYNVLANGKEIVASDFQTFYADFVSTQCSDFTVEQTSGDSESSITFTFHKGSSIKVEFYKINETQYQYSINGDPMGKITSSAYRKMIRNIKAQAETE